MIREDAALCGAAPDRDTRTEVPDLRPMSGLITVMARTRGVKARTGVSDAVPLRVRLAPANDSKVRQASAARAVSIAALMDDAISRFIFDADGQLVGLEPLSPRDRQEEFRLKSA